MTGVKGRRGKLADNLEHRSLEFNGDNVGALMDDAGVPDVNIWQLGINTTCLKALIVAISPGFQVPDCRLPISAVVPTHGLLDAVLILVFDSVSWGETSSHGVSPSVFD